MSKKKRTKPKKGIQRRSVSRKRGGPSVSAHQDLIQRALSLYQSGRMKPSEDILKTILKKEPAHQQALNLLGAIALHFQNFDAAISCFAKIIRVNPGNMNANINLAFALTGKGENDAAIECCERVLQADPGNVSALNNLANAYKEKGDFQKAISIYQKIIAIKPDFAEAYYNMGIAYQESAEYSRAIPLYEKAVSLNSRYYKAYNNLSIIRREQKRYDEAVALSERAISINPNYPEAYRNLSLIKKEQGLLDEAVMLLEKAIQYNPSFSEAYNNLSLLRKEQGFFHDAIVLAEKSAAINPHCSDTRTLLGLIYLELSRFPEAEKYFTQAVALNENDTTALLNLGILCEESGNSGEAKKYYSMVLQGKPDHVGALARLLYLLRKTCEWGDIQNIERRLDGLTGPGQAQGEEQYEYPFLNLIRRDDHRGNHAVAVSYGGKLAERMKSLGVSFSYSKPGHPSRKIKVGYLSADFRNHPVSHQILRLFQLHDRDAFEVYCFSHGVDDGSAYRERITRDCDVFVDIRQTDFLKAAGIINEHEIDILIDLGGYTKGNRLEICALRPAPVQIGFLGYPGTTGCEFMDYLVGDRIVIPRDHIAFYSEKIIFMPHSFMITDDSQPVADREDTSRKDTGLPEDRFVFGSFSRFYKIDIHTFDLWMEILHRVPDSVLWLPRAGRSIRQNLRHETEQRGIDPPRLFFAGFEESKADHLARLANIDLALDTLIYNGHTTTTDMLWAGVPVMTLTGNHFPSRVSASVLSALGLPELICDGPEDFTGRAVELATDTGRLHDIRTKLRENIRTKPLFNTPLYVENFESALKIVYERYTNRDHPDHVIV
jgi:protein O-GlcNAc transferase